MLIENIRNALKKKKPSGKAWIPLRCGWKILENQKKKTELLKSIDSFKVWIENSRNTKKENRSPEKFGFF